MRVQLIRRLADTAGWRQRDFDPAPATLSALCARIAAEDAGLAEALVGPGVQVALDKTLTRGDAALSGVRELAFLPPMSGG